MQQGDLILFKGNGIFSRIITALPGSDYSHIGMYVEQDGIPCVFESTSLGALPDIRTGEPINGVQLVPFAERIASYDGEVFYRSIDGYRSPECLEALSNVIDTHHGKPYEESKRELANAELDLPLPWELNKKDDSTLFCSETAALTLRAMGIMPMGGEPDNEFTPSDFARDFALCDGFSLGPIEAL